MASNQRDRVDNVIAGTRAQAVERIRQDIRECREKNGLERVIVLWTANTERRQTLVDGVHDTADNLLRAIANDSPAVAPSTLFGVASILEGVCLLIFYLVTFIRVNMSTGYNLFNGVQLIPIKKGSLQRVLIGSFRCRKKE